MVSPAVVSAKDGIVKQVADGKVKLPALGTGAGRQVVGISGGTLTASRVGPLPSSGDIRDEEADAANPNDIATLAISQGTLGCRTRNTDGDVRVNQDCTFRRQAEEIVKVNPSDTRNLIAGQNDSRIGYNKCGFDYSFDGGQHWGDGQPPFYQRENHPENDGPNPFNPNRNTILGGPGTAHTYDAGSDPALAFDSSGHAFYSCVLFDVNSNAGAVLVTQSPQGAGGSFYDNVAAGSVPPGAKPSASTKRFVVVEDNGNDAGTRIVVHDKEFITADAFSGSPNRDVVYVTWTVFIFDVSCINPDTNPGGFCEAPIYGSMSTDHAQTWSTPEEISGSSPLCFQGNAFDPSRPATSCDIDQGSDPQPMPNGNLVVPFFNQNTAVDNPNWQQLAVVCHPTGSSPAGTAHLNCAAPNLVGFDVAAGEPLCDFGRGPEECVPGPWIRTNDFPRVALDAGTNGNSLYVVWQDYRHGEYDIQISRSNDGGKTWKEGGTVNGQRGFDFYEPAVAVGSENAAAASFYRSDRVPNENSTPAGGFAPGMPGVQVASNHSSYWLAGRQQPDKNAATPFSAARVSPFFAPPDGNQIGFNGDYSGLAAFNKTAYPIWSDTRNSVIVTSPSQGVVHDEDVFITAHPIPNGGGGDEDQQR